MSTVVDNTSGLTEYERKRLENVKRNQAVIASLGIQNTMSDLQTTVASKKPEVKGYKRSADKISKPREEPVVTRRLRSSRISWSSADEDAKEDLNIKEVPLEEDTVSKSLKRPLPLPSVYKQGESIDSFVQSFQDLQDRVPLCQFMKAKKTSKPENIELSKFSLKSEDRARVVPERIMSVAFLPVRHKLMLTAGDKGGHLGFWDVNCENEGGGVHLFKPHASPVSGIAISNADADKVYACSYDGTVKYLDVERAMFDLIYSSEDDSLISAIASTPGSPYCFYIAEGEGSMRTLDTRQESSSQSFNDIHERRINTIDINQEAPWMVLTSSTDSTVQVWDIRKMKGSSIATIQHQRAVHSAYFSPSGNSIATCSYDNTIALMSNLRNKDGGLTKITDAKLVYIDHPNVNNRWISTFRAIWGWDDEYVYVGNMKRTIDVISTSSRGMCYQLSSPEMSSIPSRLAAHPLMHGILAGCTAGGQVYIWRH